MKKLTWFELLSQKRCTNCNFALVQPERGPVRAFCPNCTALLPAVVSLHLDRALTSRWYVGWWRLACRLLRSQPVKLPKKVKKRGVA